MKIVIVGGGIAGVSTAYFLSQTRQDLEIVIVDEAGLAAGASGLTTALLRAELKGNLSEFAAKSFDLVKSLAQDLGVDEVGYKPAKSVKIEVPRDWETMDLTMSSMSSLGSEKLGSDLFDVDRLTELEVNGDESNCAQISPKKLIQRMFEASGAELVEGRLLAVNKKELNGVSEISSIQVYSNAKIVETIKADKFCFCLGAWTEILKPMGVLVPESLGRKSTSVLLEPIERLRNNLSNASGTTIRSSRERMELTILPDGKIAAHVEDKQNEKVSQTPHELSSKISKKSVKKIGKFIDFICPNERIYDAVLEVKTSHVPYVEHYCGRNSKVPIMCQIPDLQNGFVNAGHGENGILLGPLSGKVVAELVVSGESGIDLDLSLFELRKEEMIFANSRRSACRATRINGVLRCGNSRFRGGVSAPL